MPLGRSQRGHSTLLIPNAVGLDASWAISVSAPSPSIAGGIVNGLVAKFAKKQERFCAESLRIRETPQPVAMASVRARRGRTGNWFERITWRGIGGLGRSGGYASLVAKSSRAGLRMSYRCEPTRVRVISTVWGWPATLWKSRPNSPTRLHHAFGSIPNRAKSGSAS